MRATPPGPKQGVMGDVLGLDGVAQDDGRQPLRRGEPAFSPSPAIASTPKLSIVMVRTPETIRVLGD